MNRFCQALGVLLMAAGVVLNEWVIKYLSHGSIKFAEIQKQIFMVILDIFLIILGYLFFRYKKVILQNLLLVLGSVFFSFCILEFTLDHMKSNLNVEAPLWIPYQQKMLNMHINERHEVNAKQNMYGFNDKNYRFQKPPGVTRIAVLGDSFIWGVGVKDHMIWTHKLEHMLNQNGGRYEIFNWGKPGWSTLDEYQFLKSDGVKYEFDLLIVDFVVNDPVMNDSNIKCFIYSGGIVDRFFVQPVSKYMFPNAISFTVDLVNDAANSFFGYGYENWLKDVYAPENLKHYQELLKDMVAYCNAHHMRVLFVMTPENHNPWLEQYFEQVKPLLKNAGIPYVDLYPEVYKELHNIPNRQLWANPADGHPGDKVTDVYANYMYHYLMAQGYLQPSGGISHP